MQLALLLAARISYTGNFGCTAELSRSPVLDTACVVMIFCIDTVCMAYVKSTEVWSMKAILVQKHGGPDVLQLVDVPDLTPTGDQVLVQHQAIGVNFVDTQHRTGVPYPVTLPLIPGTEAAGVVAAIGPDVTNFQPGDRVGFAGYMSGVYADASVVPQSRLVSIPEAVTFDQAAAVLLQGMTAHALRVCKESDAKL